MTESSVIKALTQPSVLKHLMSVKIERAPLGQLQDVLPKLLSTLSIGRAQIALEQIRSHLEHRPHEEIFFWIARQQAEGSPPLAAFIAIQQPGTALAPSSDVATIIHAGFLLDHANENSKTVRSTETGTSEQIDANSDASRDTLEAEQDTLIRQMRAQLDCDLRNRGIRFVQWATDADQNALNSQRWHEGLEFKKIATLDYLTGDVATGGKFYLHEAAYSDATANARSPAMLQFRPLLWGEPQHLCAFTELVEATYSGTLDCPELAEYRSTSETLRGYQTASSFDPSLWFEVLDARYPAKPPVGCMILAQHGDEPTSSDDGNRTPTNLETREQGGQIDSEPPADGPVIEIVYMGLVPEARGKGYGSVLVDQAAKIARSVGGSRFILGVDRNNQPARDIYRSKGMIELLSETVWVKQINSEI